MKVLIATAADAPWSRDARRVIGDVARADRIGEHVLTDHAEAADIILFVDAHQHLADWRQRALRRHPLVRAFPQRVFVYDERDVPRDALPGVYVSMPQTRFDERRHRAFGYFRLMNDTRDGAHVEPDLLFSFQGRRAARVRDDVLALSHPRAIIEDTSAFDFFGGGDGELGDAQRRYREVVGRSKFVLCPRGAGVSSIRLFEALACGRVPVVLSDDWVPPSGIDWASCSVRIPERETGTIISRLEALESEWPSLAASARRVYADWFAPEIWFHRTIEHCRELSEAGAAGTSRQWTDLAAWRDGGRHWKATALRSVRRAHA